jgi:hypothetical protein
VTLVAISAVLRKFLVLLVLQALLSVHSSISRGTMEPSLNPLNPVAVLCVLVS